MTLNEDKGESQILSRTRTNLSYLYYKIQCSTGKKLQYSAAKTEKKQSLTELENANELSLCHLDVTNTIELIALYC